MTPVPIINNEKIKLQKVIFCNDWNDFNSFHLNATLFQTYCDISDEPTTLSISK